MTKHRQANSSSNAAKRLSLMLLLRSVIAAGAVAGFVSSASAQSGLALPSFPENSSAFSLPVSLDVDYPVVQKTTTSSTSKRVAVLLGLKKQTHTSTPLQSISAITLPSFPSTEPTLTATPFVPDQTASNSHSPEIFRSTSGKMGSSETEHNSDTIVLASADESLPKVSISPSLVPPTSVVQTDLEQNEPAEEESLDVSLSELSSETLIDIEIPKAPVQVVQQRLPELLKRSPAMQLHIGGNVGGKSKITDAEQRTPPSTNFTLSDADEGDSEKSTVTKPASNSMNVRIEGEPAKVVARSTASSETVVIPQKKISFDPASYSTGHKALTDKSLTDKSADQPPVIGERLEVGLHESANVETTQPISGLSVEHPELCQVLKSGERSVSFVGLKAGQTRVALFTTNASGERKIEVREVVIAGAENRQADMKSLATEIGRSVHRMYPNSHIEVIAEAEGLTVQGYAGSEAEAKKIIGLVRRTSLQPVVDRLATYK